MKKYLIGEHCQFDPSDRFGIDEPLYAFRFVDILDKKDLLRVKEDRGFMIIDIYDQKWFNAASNEWVPISESEKYAPWDKK